MKFTLKNFRRFAILLTLIHSFVFSGCATLLTSDQDSLLNSPQDSMDTTRDEVFTEEDPFQREDRLAESQSHSSSAAAGSYASTSEVFDPGKNEIARALRTGVVIQGMTPQNVISLLGNPDYVDNAGSARLGNSRWTYSNGLSDRWKLSSPRMIYFESGRVIGWANMDANQGAFKH